VFLINILHIFITNIVDKCCIIVFVPLHFITVMGDLNARTSDDNDFIQNDSNDNTVPQHDDYTPDVEIINLFSRDTVLLSRGRALHDMCIQTGLRILNGRCIGDLTGNFTCHNFHGC
jgi:hypothetical protein